ncbi:MAG: AIR synthase-related protein [Spirochaetia bacterium]|jgi:phosphoribosylformylglycinamidine synthase|nr:AIR synthase-related protein [Spirochaetia bacterium]
MRIEVRFRDTSLDGRASGLAAKLTKRLGTDLSVVVVDVVMPGAPVSPDRARFVFSDAVTQLVSMEQPLAADPALAGWSWLIEVAWRPGVTDTLAATAREAVELDQGIVRSGGPDGGHGGGTVDSPYAGLRTARQYLLYGSLSEAQARKAAAALHNPLVQAAVIIPAADWAAGARPPAAYPAPDVHDRPEPETIAVAAMDDAALLALSADRLLALSLEEMQSVRDWFGRPEVKAGRLAAGLPEDATDVEIEMIAQTWSEHCKHKIFNADIVYEEPGQPAETIKSLYKSYIKQTTADLAPHRDFLRSVFTDNAGVVAFHEGSVLCVKAETHNSPSALDPYGGAITGIVGVNRDILGTGMGAKPIFNTNVLCFGYPDMPEADLPAGLLHPADVLEGVHHGIVDGGNQSGIPTAAGAFLFDDSFAGKPLVFCGTGGIMPELVSGKPSWEKEVRPGALAVMLGGRIGKDGIHGATFSSLALDETSPVSAVQIGDPIIQRRMTDFLLEARDAGLYEAITDNGAGGLSSSLGEMAESSGGIRIDLDACPLKYPGLSPWEILVSESQERMSLAVDPGTLEAFMALAARRGVEATVVGQFTDSGYIDIRANGKPAGLLSLDFIHHGLPTMRIPARWKSPDRRVDPVPVPEAQAGTSPSDQSGANDWTGTLLAILADPNVASKEALVRQYDHEVQARSVEKPFTGLNRDAPSDGAVLRVDMETHHGITVTHGICPRYSDYDTARMARMAVDEAYRAHIALGGDPDKAAALDNFCWPDPVESPGTPDGAYKAAQLVRACRGLREACLAYGLPLVSGKDSMKNDARAGGRKISVRPTLLVTLMGAMNDVRKALSTDFMDSGDLVYILGDTNGELGCTMFERVSARLSLGEAPDVDLARAEKLYRGVARAISGRILRSRHDCSDGGLAVALAESCLGGRVGLKAQLDGLPGAWSVGTAGTASGQQGSPAADPAPVAPYSGAAARALFSESGGRFVVSIRQEDRERFEETLSGLSFRLIGQTTEEPGFSLSLGGNTVVQTTLDNIREAFMTPINGEAHNAG